MCRLQVPNICRTYSMWSGSTFSLLLRSHWCATHATTQRSTQCQDHVGLLCSASATVALVHGRPQMQTEQNDNLCQPEFCLPPPSLLFYSTEQNLIHCSLKGGTAETTDPSPLPLHHYNARNYVYLSREVTSNSSPNRSPGLPRSPRTENCHTSVLLFTASVDN